MQQSKLNKAWSWIGVTLIASALACHTPAPKEQVRSAKPGDQPSDSDDPSDPGRAGRSSNDDRDAAADEDDPSSGPGMDGGGSQQNPDELDGAIRSPNDPNRPNDPNDPVDLDAEVPPTPPFSKRRLLQSAGECAQLHYRDFLEHARALEAATATLRADHTGPNADAARDAWLAAMASWQRSELMRFGPAAASTDPGGQNLRDEIYIFPLGNACLVDQQIVSRAYEEDDFASSLGSARGLSALEYLLFHDGADNACLAQLAINTDGSWDALSTDELAVRRAAYAAVVAQQVLASAEALVAAWDPAQGNFFDQLFRAGDDSEAYPVAQDALNALSTAMFYLEHEAKDLKLGVPLGVHQECPNAPETCPNSVESRYARVSTDNLRQNLSAFRDLFQGCGPRHSGLGFDDWLETVGSQELAQRMLNALDSADRAVDALSPPLEDAIVTDPAAVRVVHTAVKAVTDPLKTELITVLNLELPQSAVGDND